MSASNQTTKPWRPAEIERLEALRLREVQALGAAVSRRNWHETEMAYNQLRDAIDRTLIDLKRRNPPLEEWQDWQMTEAGGTR